MPGVHPLFLHKVYGVSVILLPLRPFSGPYHLLGFGAVVRTRASSINISPRGCLKCYLLALVKATGKNYVLGSP